MKQDAEKIKWFDIALDSVNIVFDFFSKGLA